MSATPATEAQRPDSHSRLAAAKARAGTPWLFGLAIVVFTLGGGLTIWSTVSLLRARDSVTRTRQVLTETSDLSTAVSDVAAASRAFALTGREGMLRAYRQGASDVYLHLDRLSTLTADDPVQQQRLSHLRAQIDDQAGRIVELLQARRAGGLVGAAQVATRNVDAAVVDGIQSSLKSARAREDSLLDSRRITVRSQTYLALGIEILLGTLSVLIVALAALRLLRERRALAHAERVALAAQEELGASITSLRARTAQLTTLSELSGVLGICITMEEFHSAVATTLARAVPGSAGAIGIISNSRSLVEVPVRWGTDRMLLEPYAPDHCCALRSGRPFGGEPAALPISCSHGRLTANHRSLCVPLVAQGETLGVLHLWLPAGMPVDEADHCQELVISIGEHLALALANLKAHDALRHQATRDPLTGAYNRRFMMEALERELLRARRAGRSVGLLMLDVDHFKQFNDAFGHQAGDEVLKVVVQQIRESVRAEDYVCRYGGEEFAVLLPEADTQAACERAEQLRRLVEAATRGREGGAVTVSVGVAASPGHGTSSAELISRADAALYAAKRAGRNRIQLAIPLEAPMAEVAA
jgi:diguanylate cyclase (GGDEF)-like protein